LKTFARLFRDFDEAVKHVSLWITPHRDEGSENNLRPKQIEKELREVARDRPEVRELVTTLLKQCAKDGAHPLMTTPYKRHAEDGTMRDRILAEMEDASEIEEDDPIYSVTFPKDQLINRLLALVPMEQPSDKCALPLSDEAIDALDRYARQLRDLCQEKCEHDQLDFVAVARYLDTLSCLVEHLRDEQEVPPLIIKRGAPVYTPAAPTSEK
jgi:hypothetical protein